MTSTKSPWGETSLLNLVRERRQRTNLYNASSYWDARAASRDGLARSIWPSNVFNGFWDERQRTILQRMLGAVAGRRVVDVGCGTGRMVRFMAAQGAQEVLGLDFSEETVNLAREETSRSPSANTSCTLSFEVGNVLQAFAPALRGKFDDALVLGCLSVACQTQEQLGLAFGHVASLVRPGGRVLLLEPIHRSPLLRRVLPLGIEEWIAAANRAGLHLHKADRMGFAPLRLVLSVRDLPSGVVGPLFEAGEALLDHSPYLGFLADYKCLLFTRAP
jgi:SAM-dependent methyltransferase